MKSKKSAPMAMGEYKHGGSVKKKDKSMPPEMFGQTDEMPKRPRIDRPGRRRGGAVGCDTAPLSSAARTHERSSASPK